MSKTWGVLGKRTKYLSPADFARTLPKQPLNANPLDSWDVKRSRYRRVDGVYGDDGQQAGVVPQVSPTPQPTPTPSPVPVNWNTNTTDWDNENTNWENA
jgi:hypothetical protein